MMTFEAICWICGIIELNVGWVSKLLVKNWQFRFQVPQNLTITSFDLKKWP